MKRERALRMRFGGRKAEVMPKRKRWAVDIVAFEGAIDALFVFRRAATKTAGAKAAVVDKGKLRRSIGKSFPIRKQSISVEAQSASTAWGAFQPSG